MELIIQYRCPGHLLNINLPSSIPEDAYIFTASEIFQL